VGNRLTRDTNGTVENYTYFTGTNRLQQVTGGTNPRTFAYDSNGNITGDGTLSFIYDQNNQLIEVEQGANSLAEYAYNGLGQRVIKQAGANTTVYHYDLDGKLIAESLLDGTMTREYLYMGKIRVAMVDVTGGNALYHYLNDRLGTPEILTDATGIVAWEAWYEPFGEAHIHPSSSVVNNIRLPGQYYDQETGFHYNYHRYYDPKTGRYLTPDPTGLDGGIDLYTYVDCNPINSIDQEGLIRCRSDGSVDPNGIPETPAEGAAAWAQYQYEQGSLNYTFDADTCGGSGQWKCNCFVRDALQIGGGLSGKNQVPKHYIAGKKQPTFATANELANITLNTEVLGVGDGSTGDIVAWGNLYGPGHCGIVGCNGMIYSAGKNEIYKWNKQTWMSWSQLTRYAFLSRPKVYRKLLAK
jgi:RHS repeat-associated protein